MDNLTLLFVWEAVKPDPRPYKPGMPELTPINIMVAVEVPLKIEYIYNVSDVILNQIDSDASSIPSPILTPKGMKYVVRILEDAMRDGKDKWNENSDYDSDNDDDWEIFTVDKV